MSNHVKTRVIMALRAVGLSVGQAKDMTNQELLMIPGIGRKALNLIREESGYTTITVVVKNGKDVDRLLEFLKDNNYNSF